MLPKLLLTCYTAGAIESNSIVLNNKEENWKAKVKKTLAHPRFGIFDPVEREPQKTGQDCGKSNEYFKQLKITGQLEKFDEEFDKIWWGEIIPGTDKLSIIQTIRNDFRMNGNTRADFESWADYQAVIRSDFIFAYLEKNTKTVGTYKELETAYLLSIPIYLIMPDETMEGINSSLLNMVRKSGGQVFFGIEAVGNCTEFVKNKYKIWG